MEFFEGYLSGFQRGDVTLLCGQEDFPRVFQPDLDVDFLMPHIPAFPYVEARVWVPDVEILRGFRESYDQRTSRGIRRREVCC